MAEGDDFFRLREYDSLGRSAREAQSKMEEELARLKRREAELAEREELLKQRQTQHRTLNHQMAELDRRLSQHLSAEVMSKLEAEGLQILIDQQKIEELIQEDQTFLAGFSKTLADIRSEIDGQLAVLKNQRDAALQRAELLKPQLPEGWLASYEKILQKKPAHGVFTRIQSLHCQFCRYAVSKVLESEVDTQLQLKACPGCGRLFLPHKTVAG